jgi:murein DD-endopeptidase MepM/ murein hydrolase activator NlpD
MASTALQPAAPILGSANGWTAAGGTPVMVGAGETASTLSARYGVPLAAINAANGGQVRPGQQAIIPIYSGNGSTAKAGMMAPPRAVSPPAPVAAATPRPAQQIAAAAKPAKPAKPTTTDDDDDGEVKLNRIIAAGPKTNASASPAKATPVATVQPKQAPRIIPLTAPKAEEAKPQVDNITTASIPVQKPPSAMEDKADFRWPARGRIISGFGSKGGNGDGIAIAVPEGTPVKAAADGVVAYAGEELKGYGKLVLVRHDNGYVTAYAHNGDLNVKRGEKVTRGQTIAKSGATGNVTSPQLHFELRKGSTPVDPTKFLDN